MAGSLTPRSAVSMRKKEGRSGALLPARPYTGSVREGRGPAHRRRARWVPVRSMGVGRRLGPARGTSQCGHSSSNLQRRVQDPRMDEAGSAIERTCHVAEAAFRAIAFGTWGGRHMPAAPSHSGYERQRVPTLGFIRTSEGSPSPAASGCSGYPVRRGAQGPRCGCATAPHRAPRGSAVPPRRGAGSIGDCSREARPDP